MGLEKMLDPLGVHRQHKKEVVKDVMKQSAFKMTGYSYPGVSPIKKDISSVSQEISQKVLDANALEKEKVTKKVKRKENIKKVETKVGKFASSKLGQTMISSAVSSILAPKPQKEPTRIISKDWKIA